MSLSIFDSIEVEAISSCVPKREINNIDHEFLFTEKEKKRLIKLTGIKQRRFAAEDQTASDLAFDAVSNLFDKHKVDKKSVKSLVFMSQTPDYKIPFSSNILQNRLGLPNETLCVDLNAGCSGFISGMQTAFSIANGLSEGKVLFVVAETLSKVLSNKDRSTSLLFGDGASALLISKTKRDISQTVFKTYSDGAGYDSIIIPSGGFRNIADIESLEDKTFEDGSTRNDLQLRMNGEEVFDFTMREVVPALERSAVDSGVSLSNIDFFAFHQANKLIIKNIALQLDLDLKKVLFNIEMFGNTSGVSIPLLLNTELPETGDRKVLCCGFGAGLSWGTAMIDFSNTCIYSLIEK